MSNDAAAALPVVYSQLAGARATIERLSVALGAARHALTVTHNLMATDKPNAFDDALDYGFSAKGARKIQQEASWVIDNSKEIAMIDAVLA